MDSMIKTTISLEKRLFDQAESYTQQINISTNHFFEIAIKHFIENYQVLDEQNPALDQDAKSTIQYNGEPIVINQGDIFWIKSEDSGETDLGYYPHPYVVIQDNIFNHSRINSVVVCALTSNLKQANAPGNVLLERGEANLPKHSAIVVSKVSTVNKSQLSEYIGSLNEQRVNQILAGMRFLQLSFFAR